MLGSSEGILYSDLQCLWSSGSFASLACLRYLVIDEADKILDYHFNQWLPKLLEAVASDKDAHHGHGRHRGELLSGSLLSVCSQRDIFRLQKASLGLQSKVQDEGFIF